MTLISADARIGMSATIVVVLLLAKNHVQELTYFEVASRHNYQISSNKYTFKTEGWIIFDK